MRALLHALRNGPSTVFFLNHRSCSQQRLPLSRPNRDCRILSVGMYTINSGGGLGQGAGCPRARRSDLPTLMRHDSAVRGDNETDRNTAIFRDQMAVFLSVVGGVLCTAPFGSALLRFSYRLRKRGHTKSAKNCQSTFVGIRVQCQYAFQTTGPIFAPLTQGDPLIWRHQKPDPRFPGRP